MELFLLNVVAFMRPIASIRYGEAIFDLASIAIFGLVLLVFLSNSAQTKDIQLRGTDLIIGAFVVWCLATYIVYFQTSQLRDVAKLLIPLVTYVVAKNAVRTELQYRRILSWIIVGFSIPLLLSVGLVVSGYGIDYVSYWTGLPRWEGAYMGAHSMGHSMTLLLFVVAIYAHLSFKRNRTDGDTGRDWRIINKAALLAISVLALYCLYKSQVRSAMVGLLVFACIYLFFFNRRWLIFGLAAGTMTAIVTSPYWLPVLVPEMVSMERGVGDISEIGSGRPQFWQHNLRLFMELPIDRQLAGSGIGNRAETWNMDKEQALIDSHNDWLDLLMQTGVVGLLLFAALQIALLKRVLVLPSDKKYLFLALFVAVNIMMFVSNSYTWRIQVGHLYYLLLAFIELRGQLSGTSYQHAGGDFSESFRALRKQDYVKWTTRT